MIWSIDRVDLAPGTYNHTFQCHLPQGLPTSVEGGYGHIRYWVEVVLNIPMWPDKEYSRTFTVIKMIDLNLDPMMRVNIIHDDNRSSLPSILTLLRFFFCVIHFIYRNQLYTGMKGHFRRVVFFAVGHRAH